MVENETHRKFTNHDQLRRDLVRLGDLLGETISDVSGQEQLELVERVRQLSRDRRAGASDGRDQLQSLLSSLDHEQLRIVIRAFTVFLDLANVAEDQHRARVLRARESLAYPDPISESIPAALDHLRDAGKTAEDIRQLVRQLNIELVFTAHPTEAKRRSVRSKLRRVRECLEASEDQCLSPLESEQREVCLRAEVAKLWLTDFIRPWRPTVLQEVKRGLSLKPNLWEVTPRIVDTLRRGVAEKFSVEFVDEHPCVHFGSWIGGDRDGHPFVTPETTEQTILWLREQAIEFHEVACQQLYDSLSLSQRQLPFQATPLIERIDAAVERWPEVDELVAEVPPDEVFRRWLRVVQWRLVRTKTAGLDADFWPGGYDRAAELLADVEVLQRTIEGVDAVRHLADETRRWCDRIRIFGFHLARLDVRQDSRTYGRVVDELLEHLGVEAELKSRSGADRQQLLEATVDRILPHALTLSQEATETLDLFRLLQRIVRRFGHETLGVHIVSMTHEPADLISVLWLWNMAAGGNGLETPIPVVPLFETIGDLEEAPRIMTELWQSKLFRAHLDKYGNHQTVMLGYSDSTKDGGYLAASWSAHQCQRELQRVADNAGIELTFFHGRGGSLGRGGGPAARSILSLPREAFHGALRLTEQGEVLADRYDDPRIAHRHLEQLVWSSLLAAGLPEIAVPDAWIQLLKEYSNASLKAYRELVDHPDFVAFFRAATPISVIEQLPIGSRPSRRRSGGSLQDLRAIPWVFSWTQSRCLVPAWYGLGAALSPHLDDADSLAVVRKMYQEWPFFRATIDNAELALAKADLEIAERYAALAGRPELSAHVGGLIHDEFHRTKEAVLMITEREELLDGIPWLKESIRVRNRYIDPLNFIQVDLLRRLQAVDAGNGDEDVDELRHLARLTVNGLAAGMRTSG